MPASPPCSLSLVTSCLRTSEVVCVGGSQEMEISLAAPGLYVTQGGNSLNFSEFIITEKLGKSCQNL